MFCKKISKLTSQYSRNSHEKRRSVLKVLSSWSDVLVSPEFWSIGYASESQDRCCVPKFYRFGIQLGSDSLPLQSIGYDEVENDCKRMKVNDAILKVSHDGLNQT